MDAGMNPQLEALLQHAEWARALAGRLVADAARADDVVQSALASAAKSPPRDATNLRGWLGTVVRNAARGSGREESRRTNREHAAAKSEALESAHDLVARAEMSRDLAQHVLALDDIYRDAVLLRWFEGLAPREIAKRLDVPLATVNSRLARAHAELRTRLDRSYGDRATWCAAFAPLAVMPTSSVSAGGIVSALIAAALLIAGAAAVLSREAEVAPTVEIAEAIDPTSAPDVAPRSDTSNATELALVDEASARTAVRDATASSGTSSPSSLSIASKSVRTPVHGRILDMMGRPLAGVRVRGFDPSLPKFEGGGILIDGHVNSFGPGILDRLRTDPALLASLDTLLEHPPGLVELITGVDMASQTTTGSDGIFAMSVLGSRPNVSLDDEWIVVTTGRSAEYDGDTWLVARAVEVSGTIVDQLGNPVSKARIDCTGEDAAIAALPFELETESFRNFAEWHSDTDGRFDLGRIATFPGARLIAALESQFIADIEMPSASTSNLILHAKVRPIPPKPHVRGVVLDAHGAGIADVNLRFEGVNATSDKSGAFEFEANNFDPESELVATKRGLQPGWIVGFGRELREKGIVEGVEIRLRGPALSITGHALRADGSALAGWWFSLEDTIRYPTMGMPIEFAAMGLFGNDQQPKTDANGRFEIGGLADKPYRVQLIDRQSGLALVSDPIAAGARDVEIRLPADAWRERIRGRVISTLGAPVEDVEVGVMYPITEGRGFSNSGYAQKAVSAADGGFEFEHVPRRGLKLSVHGTTIRGDSITVPADVDPMDVVVTVTVQRTFRVELPGDSSIDGFEVVHRTGSGLRIDAQMSNGGTTVISRVGRVAGEFPICQVSEEGTTLVLYTGDVEVRRVPITWTEERVQVIRP